MSDCPGGNVKPLAGFSVWRGSGKLSEHPIGLSWVSNGSRQGQPPWASVDTRRCRFVDDIQSTPLTSVGG